MIHGIGKALQELSRGAEFSGRRRSYAWLNQLLSVEGPRVAIVAPSDGTRARRAGLHSPAVPAPKAASSSQTLTNFCFQV